MVAIYAPTCSLDPARINEVDEEWLGDRPQLLAAVSRGRVARMQDKVMLFVNHRAGWSAVPTHAVSIGAIAPHEPLVQAYEVRVEKEQLQGIEVMVFAPMRPTRCVGIAGWSPIRGWAIYPPEHEMVVE